MNCKQGDLAIIIGGSLNAGKIVRVVEPYVHRDQIVGGVLWDVSKDYGFVWCVEAAGSPIVHLSGITFTAAPFPDSRLRPISGLHDEESTTDGTENGIDQRTAQSA